MKNILVVTSSVRDGRKADKILELVQSELHNYPDVSVTVADFKALPLPFLDTETLPSADDFVPAHKNVAAWSKMVSKADAVIMLVAEYNHSFTPVIKNAIDWLYKEWHEKPVALIGYGWVGAARATAQLRAVLASNINAKALETEANLRFMKEIDVNGEPLNDDAAREINKVLAELELGIRTDKRLAPESTPSPVVA